MTDAQPFATAPVLTMGGMIRASAQSFAAREAVVFPDRRISYAELDAAARRWAAALIALGVPVARLALAFSEV